jgi:hypothetical protein
MGSCSFRHKQRKRKSQAFIFWSGFASWANRPSCKPSADCWLLLTVPYYQISMLIHLIVVSKCKPYLSTRLSIQPRCKHFQPLFCKVSPPLLGVNRLLVKKNYRHTGETYSVHRGGAPLPRLPSTRGWTKSMPGRHFAIISLEMYIFTLSTPQNGPFYIDQQFTFWGAGVSSNFHNPIASSNKSWWHCEFTVVK